MRTSSYVHYTSIPETSSFFLVHGYSGAIDKVPSHVVRYLLDRRAHSESTHTSDEEIALAALAESPDEQIYNSPSPQTLEMLVKHGYLTAMTVEQEYEYVVRIARSVHERSARIGFPSFLLIPTYQCNLRCPYCFESDARSNMHRDGRLNHVMTPEMLDAAFATMDNLYLQVKLDDSKREVLRKGQTVILYGGEPLQELTLPIIQRIVEKGKDREMRFTAITNGIDLHRFTNLLTPDGISAVQITIDGPRSTHDRNRIGPSHRKTYDRILENIGVALERNTRISLRVHADWDSIKDTPSILDDMRQRGYLQDKNLNIYISPRHLWHINDSYTVQYPIEPHHLHSEILRWHIEESSHVYVSQIRFVERKLTRYIREGLIGLSSRMEYCRAYSGTMHILDPFGDVYGCWDFVGKPEECIGHYTKSGVSYTARAKDWKNRCPAEISACSKCKYVMFHFGGCVEAAVSTGQGLLTSACCGFESSFITMAKQFFQQGQHERVSVLNITSS